MWLFWNSDHQADTPHHCPRHVFSVFDQARDINNDEVLKMALENVRIFITLDMDFCHKIFSEKHGCRRWSGPKTTPLQELCQTYLWRLAIEHLFRFGKQHLGLNANQSTDPVSIDQWTWLCPLAYWQLLLIRDGVDNVPPALYLVQAFSKPSHRTPGQVQRGALRFSVRLGTAARANRTAGKGKGRAKGYHPAPRVRFPVVKKAKFTLFGLRLALKSDFSLLFLVFKVRTPFGA